MDATVRHFWVSNKFKDILSESFERSHAAVKKSKLVQTLTQNFNKGAVVPKAAATLERVKSWDIMKFGKTKIGKGGLVAAAGIIGWNMIQHTIKSALTPQPAIPRNYDRGYDTLNENFTDFNSPVNLAKAANKTITPYKSAVRRGTYTTSRSVIDSNIALKMSKNAIKHHHY